MTWTTSSTSCERTGEPMTPEDVRGAIRALDAQLRADMRERWNCDLPLDELLSDRWERALSLGFGEGSSIYASSYVYGDVRVGDNVWIGPNTILDGSGGLSIGRGTTISAGVQIYSHDTVQRTLSGGALPIEVAAVSIGDHTYIGAGTVIAKGVAIADHVVVGALSFVNRDIDQYSVAAGSPCRTIGRVVSRDDGSIELVYP